MSVLGLTVLWIRGNILHLNSIPPYSLVVVGFVLGKEFTKQSDGIMNPAKSTILVVII